MYHIKKDKRTQASVVKICDGLAACAQAKPFQEIGVAEIAASAGVSRATFYRIFDTPHDVLVYLCEKLVSDLMQTLPLENLADNHEKGLKTLEYLTEHADQIAVVFKSGRLDLFQKALEPNSERLVPPIAKHLSERELDYARISTAARLTGILYVWNLHGRKESPREILHILGKIEAE